MAKFNWGRAKPQPFGRTRVAAFAEPNSKHKKHKAPTLARLRRQLAKTKDPERRAALKERIRKAEHALTRADDRSVAARKAARSRRTGKSGEERAKRQLQAAAWRRDNPRR